MNLEQSIGEFYGIKNLQPSYKFLVSFFDTPKEGKQSFPPILHYHVRGVTIPHYRFKKEVMEYNGLGKQFPIFDHVYGLDLRIEFDEDQQGTVAQLVRYCHKRILNEDGTYNAPDSARIRLIQVDILGFDNVVRTRYNCYGCFLFETEDMLYSYDNPEGIKYTLTFAVDYVTVETNPNNA